MGRHLSARRLAVGQIVFLETNGLKRTVRFLGRGSESPAGAEAIERNAQQDAEEEAVMWAAELDAATPVRVRPLDWVAAVVAVVLQLGCFSCSSA